MESNELAEDKLRAFLQGGAHDTFNTPRKQAINQNAENDAKPSEIKSVVCMHIILIVI